MCYIVTDVSNIHFAFKHIGVNITVVGTEITSLLPVFCEKLDHFLTWPTEEDWLSRQGIWTKLPIAVGAIDGTSR